MGLFGSSKTKEEKAEEILSKLKPGTHRMILTKISYERYLKEDASIVMTPSQLKYFSDEHNYPMTYCEGYAYDSFTDPLISDLTSAFKRDFEYKATPIDYEDKNIRFGDGDCKVVIDHCDFNLFLLKALMKYKRMHLSGVLELIEEYPCVAFKGIDQSSAEEVADVLTRIGAQVHVEGAEEENGFDQLLESLISSKEEKKSDKIQVDVNDERFYEATEEDAAIIYVWNIQGLKKKDLDFLEEASLGGKTLHKAALSLGLDVKWEDNAAEVAILNAGLDEEEAGDFVILMQTSGTLREHYPFMAALYAKYPYADIQYAAFQNNINSYNAFGGPWSGGVKRREMTEDQQYLVYYLSEDENSFTMLPSQHEEDIKEWMDENVEGLVNYKVVPLHEAKIVNIDWDKEMEYFSYSSNNAKVQEVAPAPAEEAVSDSESASEEENYFSERLERLIASALSDGVLTEKEKEIILRRAEKEGEDEDEVMMIIESRLKKMKK